MLLAVVSWPAKRKMKALPRMEGVGSEGAGEVMRGTARRSVSHC